MASAMCLLVMAAVLVVSSLTACASPAGSGNAEICIGAQIQGNGGSANRCTSLPTGCMCQEM